MALFCLSPQLAGAADLQTIKRRGRLIVAVKENLSPLGFRGVNGQLEGFEIDLARQVASELLGNPNAIELRPVLNQDRARVVLDGEVDLAIAQMSPTPSRLRILSFSRAYYRDGLAIVTRDGNVRSLQNLEGKSVAVLRGSDTAEALQRRYPNIIVHSVSSYQAANHAVQTGQAIAVAADASVLTGWIQEFPDYHFLSDFLSPRELAIAFPKGQQYNSLRQAIDQALTRLDTSRWLEERATYWGLPRIFPL